MLLVGQLTEHFVECVFRLMEEEGLTPTELQPEEALQLAGLKASDLKMTCEKCDEKDRKVSSSSVDGVRPDAPFHGGCKKHVWWPVTGVMLTPEEAKKYRVDKPKKPPKAEMVEWLGLANCWNICKSLVKKELLRRFNSPPPVLCFIAGREEDLEEMIRGYEHYYSPIADLRVAVYKEALDGLGVPAQWTREMSSKLASVDEEEEGGDEEEEEEEEKEQPTKNIKRKITEESKGQKRQKKQKLSKS
jgi:hypothetical protein